MPIDLPTMEGQPENRQQKSQKRPQNQTSQNIVIYPNPATNRLFISSGEQEINQILLMDLNGTILYNIRPNSYNYKINVDRLDFGMYFIEVILKNGDFISRKIVK